ncbi:MAG: GDSL family lipase, partial [Lentisphaerae bacterium]
IQSFGNNWKTLQYKTVRYLAGQHDWTRFEGETTVPPGTQKFGIAMLIDGDGSGWLDNVELLVQ